MRPPLPTDSSPQRPVVARVIARLNVGGPAFHAVNLTGGLRDRYRTVLVSGHVGKGEADLGWMATARNLERVVVSSLGREIRPWDDAVALFRLVRLFRALRPDIVHTHTAKAGTVGRIAALIARVPVRVHTFHGHVFRGYFGRWQTRLFIWIERILAQATTRIIAISPSQAAELVTEFGICPADKVSVIPLGLDLQPFVVGSASRGRQSLAEVGVASPRVPIVSIVGRLVPIKNHGLFLDAAAELRRRGRACAFLVIGGGTEEARLRERVIALGLDDAVHFLSWRMDLPDLYAASDVVVLTSKNEGTPVCLIEALAGGRPVVSTDAGGVADVLRHGAFGTIVPQDSPALLADAIEEILDDPEGALARASRAADEVRRVYSVDRLVSEIGDLYDRLLAPLPVPQDADPMLKEAR